MDVEVIGAGRASTWRRGAEDEEEEEDAGGGVGGGGGGGGVEAQIVPLDLYDSARAKIEANLRWLFAKAYGIDNIPPDLQDPFYTDQYEQEHIKPPIIHLLLSGELYCRVCGLILHAEQAASLQSHQSVLQALSRKGIYVLESDNTQVSDVDLSSAPIKMSSHVHLIDALMMAYMVEMISIEKVVSSVKRFSNLSASKELPLDLEDAMVFWINKVNMKMKEMTEKELKMKQHLLEPSGHQKVRYRRDHLSGRALQHFPLLDDLLKDVCDGMALLALIHFYCPDLIRLEDICLKEVPSIADSLYNIELLREFSNSYLNRCFCLKPEDVLYSPPVLKNNVMVFIAELFWWFESVKPGFVQPRGLQEIRDARLLLKPKGAQSQVSSSNVTKSAFMSSSNSADVLTEPTGPDLSIKSGSLSPSHSSVPFRQRKQKTLEENLDPRNRSYSVTRGDGQHLGSVGVWPERRPRPLSQPVPYALHYPVEDDVDSLSLARSISKDSLSSNILSMTPKHMLGSGAHRSHHRLSGQSLLSHMRIEDEEEEIEEEELVAVIHPHELSQQRLSHQAFTPSRQVNSYYTEPLMPAVLKPAKEKSISLNKQEESGESPLRTLRAARRAVSNATSPSENKPPIADSSRNTFTPIPAAEPLSGPLRLPPERRAVISPSEEKQPQGFFLHLSAESDYKSPYSSTLEVGYDSDSDIADLEEDEEEDDELGITREVKKMEKEKGSGAIKGSESGEGESAKLREDSKVTERDDKEDGSGCSSPCLSTISWASSCSASGSVGVRMTSFAERKLLKLGLCEGVSSTSSSQKTTPDGSEFTSGLPWHLKVDSCLGKDSNVEEKLQIMPSELLQLHMQLEEQRRAIEHQKKKMETLSACQRLKLGKAAFLNIVKKGAGKSDTLPLPLRQPSKLTTARVRSQLCRDDSCLDTLKAEVRTSQPESRQLHKDTGNALTQGSSESGLNECSRSIDLLNEAISSIQEQMLQLSAQQNLLMKKNVASPTECGQSGPSTTPTETQTTPPTSDPRSFSVHFDICDNSSFPVGRPPRLSSSLRGKATNRKPNKEKSQQGVNSNSSLQTSESTPSSSESINGDQETGSGGESSRSEGGIQRNSTFRVTEEQSDISRNLPQAAGSKDDEGDDSRKEALGGDESSRVKGQLIEVDLSELKESRENGGPDSTAEGEQKNSLGFFFKDEEKAEDEMAKRRAAFLLKQQRKAEEARLRKQQQESESELRRDEARRKAEEDRIRKEEEKARRELIKQEYLQRKQQALIEEQGLAKPRPRTKSRKHRPKSLHREEFNSLTKGGTARMKTIDLSCSHRGSTLSLATEADSVISGDAESQRAGSVCSVESFPVLSRASSRNMERDWESGSIASSITSSEYSGPKLFKEPSSKSNKPIIINAIAHCCLAGKVNETQKNVILEELEKCESNHLIILFRDGGCQFRAIYAYSPETEEIIKFTGTGPRSITHKMVDKVYKYSSDRKQFTIIPAKSVSVSVDALTIHNHLWQVKRTGSALRK